MAVGTVATLYKWARYCTVILPTTLDVVTGVVHVEAMQFFFW